MRPFFASIAPTVIEIEACACSHHLARELEALGHTMRLLAPRLVKPCVKRGKNDAVDAEALCEAVSRPIMRFVPVKTPDQQAGLMLAGDARQADPQPDADEQRHPGLWGTHGNKGFDRQDDAPLDRPTKRSPYFRGDPCAAEFGLVAARGLDKIEPLLARIAADESLPALARELFALQARIFRALQAQLREVEAQLMARFKENALARRLAIWIPAFEGTSGG